MFLYFNEYFKNIFYLIIKFYKLYVWILEFLKDYNYSNFV